VANPDNIKNSSEYPLTVGKVDCDPTMNTINHANASTTMVRIAVATVESVFLIPLFAKIDVNPANSAEPNANGIHIVSPIFLRQDWKILPDNSNI
jgi:hypothetical protein